VELNSLLTKIKSLKDEVDSDVNREYLLKQIRESKIVEQSVKLVSEGKDTTPLFQKLFEMLESEWLDEYETVGDGAEAVALTSIDAFNKDA